MSLLRAHHAGGLMLVAVLAGCDEKANTVAPSAADPSAPKPAFTANQGSVPTLLGRATFSDPKDPNFRVKRMTGDWNFEIKAKPAFDIAVQTIAFPVGSSSGWHSHNGPVFITVATGTMTFYDSDDPTCTPVRVTAPNGFLDVGDHAHIARNESGAPAQNVVTYFAPPGVPLRVDEPNPGNCPF
jgi:hypothetical protein